MLHADRAACSSSTFAIRRNFPSQTAVGAFPAQQLKEVPILEKRLAAAWADKARDSQAGHPDRNDERKCEERQEETRPEHSVEQPGKKENSRQAGRKHPPQQPGAPSQDAPGLVGRDADGFTGQVGVPGGRRGQASAGAGIGGGPAPEPDTCCDGN